MTRITWENAVLAACGPTAQLTAGADGYRITLHCVKCDARKSAFHMRNRLPDRQVSKKIENYGWTLGRKPVCPNHQQEKTIVADIVTPSGPGLDVEKAAASEKAKRARRETVMLLDEVFDVPGGCYKGGESDETVAKTVGLATEAVAKIREDMFGPLKTPPELAAFITELDAMKADLTKIKQGVIGEIARMEERINAYRKRVEDFSKARGWSL